MNMEDEIYDRIVELCEEGDELVEEDCYPEAIIRYEAALELVPNPKYIWEASTWIYTALGDVYLLQSQFQEALNQFQEALKCPDAIGNPFIQLRIGQCFFELEDIMKAREFLLKAYMLDGTEVFEDEEEKYFICIQPMI